MKKILDGTLIIICTLLFMSGAFASGGIKTTVKGTVKDITIKTMLLANRLNRGLKTTDVVKAKGQYQLTMNLETPGFYVLSDQLAPAERLELYLNPGDQLTVNSENGKLVMSGKGSAVNQFLYDLGKKNPYDPQAGLVGLSLTYDKRVRAIHLSGHADVIRSKGVLLGNAQGEYLQAVYGSLINSRIYPGNKSVVEMDPAGLNLRLVPGIVIYPNWSQLITEFMNAKLTAGQIKVNSIHTWVADFGNAIENQQLKEEYVVALLESSVSQGDFVSIHEVIKAALPLVKNQQKRIRINAMKSTVAKRMWFYKNAMPGTDFSNFTFQDLNGKQVAISDYKNKFIFIDIWTTGCMPCMAEAPYLKKLEHEMKGKDIVFLSVSCDSGPDSWKKTIQKYDLSGGQQLLMDGGYDDPFFEKIGKSAVPRFLILDKSGKMFDYNSCKRPSNPLLKIYLDELLNLAKS